MRRLLWIGDAVVSSGFARCTHKTLDVLQRTWEVHVLGLNYPGDPHPYPYAIYPAWAGNDSFGLARTKALVNAIKPDVIVIQNDPWNIQPYLDRIDGVPVVASMPVDGKNCQHGQKLNALRHAIFWTQFGLDEARAAGFTGPATVIPLGVDLDVYSPMDRTTARRRLGMLESMDDAFIVGNANRNQPRKRLDLTVDYFAHWVRTRGIKNAYLFLHVAPTGDQGYDVQQLMRYHGLAGGENKRLILSNPSIGFGVDENVLSAIYSCLDLQISTTQGEGWGLTTMEGMACGVPQLVPDWSALGEWARPAAAMVECTNICVTPDNINVIGGVPDRAAFIGALESIYSDELLRRKMSRAGLALVSEDRFRWESIGQQFAAVLEGI